MIDWISVASNIFILLCVLYILWRVWLIWCISNSWPMLWLLVAFLMGVALRLGVVLEEVGVLESFGSRLLAVGMYIPLMIGFELLYRLILRLWKKK